MIDNNIFDQGLKWQPPSLRVRIVDNRRGLTASAEEAAIPVIVICEAVARSVIHASVPAVSETFCSTPPGL